MASPEANSTPTLTFSVTGPSLLNGTQWGSAQGQGVTLSYSFPGLTSPTAYVANDYANEFSAGWFGASASQIAAFKDALASWAAVAKVRFVQVADNASTVGEIRFAFTSAIVGGTYAHAYLPGDNPAAGDVWVRAENAGDSFARGSYGFVTLVHELGHALGLRHPFKPPALPLALDQTSYTVMSYTQTDYFTRQGTNISPSSPMDGDIYYLQLLYGANMAYRTGNDTYSFATPTVMTLWDAGGVDTLSAANQHTAANIQLGRGLATIGPFSGVYNIHIYKTVQIENATGGSANDFISGSSLANRLIGGAGNDSLFGGGGNDTLQGQGGNDRVFGETGNDTFYLAGGGQDTASGGAGSDRFVFSELNSAERDTLTDFRSEDSLCFARTTFTQLGAVGAVKGAHFVAGAGAVAHDANDYLLYDTTTGVLSYDADGTGPGAADALAVLTAHPKVALADLLVV